MCQADESNKMNLAVNGRTKCCDGQTRDEFLQSLRAANEALLVELARRQRVEHELRSTNDSLLQANEKLRYFTLVAAHDLKRPARTIAIAGQRLLQLNGNDLQTETAGRWLKELNQASDRLQRLLQSLFDHSRSNTPKSSFVFVDLNDILEEAARELESV